MTNPLRGEVTFEARGKTFTFRLGTNAQIMIESKVGMPLSKFFGNVDEKNFGSSDIRTVFHAGLFRQHQMNEEDVGDLMDELGPERVGEIFAEAAKAAFGDRISNGAGENARPIVATKEPTGMNS
jgi:hypothetical protein